MEIVAEIKDGLLPDYVKKIILNFLKKTDNKKIIISLNEYKPKRSINQNAYWFQMINKYVIPKFREVGLNYDDEFIHQILMTQLGYTRTIEDLNGNLYKVRVPSKKFTKTEWEEFMQRARAHLATEYSIFLPLPNEYLGD